MIQLTRLNNQLLVVNSELIKFIECAPDTVLTLVTGEKVVVRESLDLVLQKVREFRRSIASRTEPDITASASPPRDGGPTTGAA